VSADESWTQYWHSTSRYVAYHFVKDAEYVLFLDADEICDTKRFIDWLELTPYRFFTAFSFPGYFYFLRPEYQCQVHFGSMLFARREDLGAEALLSVDERKGTFQVLGGKKEEGILALDNVPIFHHYSWVRSKKELYRKVRTCGDMAEKLERLEAEPFTGHGTDPVHGLPYNIVDTTFDPLKVDVDFFRKREIHRGYDVRQYPNVVLTDRLNLLLSTT
jgi:hypothetical protein